MPRSGSSFALFVLIFATAIQNAGAAALNVLDAWVRIPPPGADLAAVYFTVRNVSPHTVIIEGAEAPPAGMAMLHESRISNGKLEMRMLDTVVIAPGQSVLFAPNGRHLMLHGLTRKLLVGEKLMSFYSWRAGEKSPSPPLSVRSPDKRAFSQPWIQAQIMSPPTIVLR